MVVNSKWLTPSPGHPPAALTDEGTTGLGQSWRPPSRTAATSPPLPTRGGPRSPPPSLKSPGSVNPIERSGSLRGHPLLSPSPFCSQGPRGPSLARAAPLPRAWRSGTLCAGQPQALAAIQGGERRGKQRAGEGRGGEPRAQEQRRAPHRTAPRTLADSRDARAAAWAHQPGHLVPEVSPERRSGAGRPGAAGVGGGDGERAAGAGGCPGSGGRTPRSSQTRRRCAGRGKSRWVAVAGPGRHSVAP
ncbi:hypothetical protein LEMLEM_LOCUS534 [Lemmus lemmus]